MLNTTRWRILASGLILCSLAIASGCRRAAVESKKLSEVGIGVTQRNEPYLWCGASTDMTYRTNLRRFSIELRTKSGSKIGILEGDISKAADDGRQTITVAVETSQQLRISPMGMKDITVEPAGFDPKAIDVAAGKTALKITGTFEYTYEW